jgi:transposase, IS6 family
MASTRPAVFKGRHFQDRMIVLCVRWYLRYCLTLRDLEEMMAERGLEVDHSTIGRWVLRYAPELYQRIRKELRFPNRSWRLDETLIKVRGQWKYLYRAVDSNGETIDFLLSEQRDAATAKQFLLNALAQTAPIRPRVVNVDGHAAYPPAVSQLKAEHRLSARCRCRRAPYLNNVLEQDHRFIKKRIAASLWFRTGETAVCTIAGYEAMNMIRKGQVRWVSKGDLLGQIAFIENTLGVAG